MSESGDTSKPSGVPARFNFEDKHRLTQEAGNLRQGLISGVFRLFQEFHIEDITTRHRLALPRYRLWLVLDSYDVPSKENRPQDSLAFAVESPIRGDKKERLRFHVPIPADFDRDSLEALEELEEPDTICAERVLYTARKAGRTTIRYAIDHDHTYMYRSASDTGSDEEIYPDDDAVWDEFNSGFSSGIGLIATLNEDLINWERVKQRLMVRGEDDSVRAYDI